MRRYPARYVVLAALIILLLPVVAPLLVIALNTLPHPVAGGRAGQQAEAGGALHVLLHLDVERVLPAAAATSASALIGILPAMLFFLLFQRTLTRGITAGAIK